MRQSRADKYLTILANLIVSAALLMSVFMLNSFSIHHIGDDFMKQLGITKTAADEKISGSVLSGSLDAYGLKNIKNVVLGDRAQIAKDLLVYTKQYLASDAFKKEYEKLKQDNKPTRDPVKTPAEMKDDYIVAVKKMITSSEEGLKKNNASMKTAYEKMLADGKKELAETESGKNKNLVAYEKNYPQLVKDMDAMHEARIAEWEKNFPSDPSHFVKRRLEQFIVETSDIDYNAQLVTKGGVKYFVKSEYESKGDRWKMAFRAGKEVVEPAKAFVNQWISEIK